MRCRSSARAHSSFPRWLDLATAGTGRDAIRILLNNGVGRIRIQTREDGVSIDQVVLSSNRFAATRPGAAKNDTTILPITLLGEQ
jgi:hypothetical protein